MQCLVCIKVSVTINVLKKFFGKLFAYMAYITYILLYSSTFKFTFSNKDGHWVSTIFSIVCFRKLNWDFRQSIPSFVSCIVLFSCWSLCNGKFLGQQLFKYGITSPEMYLVFRKLLIRKFETFFKQVILKIFYVKTWAFL